MPKYNKCGKLCDCVNPNPWVCIQKIDQTGAYCELKDDCKVIPISNYKGKFDKLKYIKNVVDKNKKP